MTAILCVDVGSTFTKAVLADQESGELLATAEHPTMTSEVLASVAAVRQAVQQRAGTVAAQILVCSSAGGGLRLAVVGYERLITAEAGQRVALSAGGRVVHVASGRLDRAAVEALRASGPDLIVLTGGTDGGNGEVVVHNARRLGIARLPVPVILAANVDAAQDAAAELTGRGRSVTVTANVLPQIGRLDPLPARQAIREAFLAHVIGGKGLSRGSSTLDGRTFAELVRAPTPDAVLSGLEVLGSSDDVLLVDVGGATTDVYSVLAPHRAAPGRDDARPPAPAAGELWPSRTVEGDLGVRWGAVGVVEAARAEGLLDGPAAETLARYAEVVRADPAHLAGGDAGADRTLAALAAMIAVRRHGRPVRPGAPPRALREVERVIGSGGVLRHASAGGRAQVLRPLLADHAGGWAVPDRAGLAVDAGYTLFAAGLLAPHAPAAAARLAAAGLVRVQGSSENYRKG
jgi:uncharacterized protein (TIGR01319 family)